MIARRTFSSVVAILSAGALLAAAGCAQQQNQQASGNEPASTQANGAGQPSSGKTGGPTAWMAFPTGDRSTSVILVSTTMPREVRAKTPFNYDINVENLTGQTLENVVLSGSGFQNQSVVSAIPPATGPANGPVWNLGEIGPHQTKKIQVNATAPVTGGSSNCFTVSYSNALCAKTSAVNPVLVLSKKGPAEVLLCDVFDYTFEIKNTGSGSAENVHVKDTLPSGLTTLDGKTSIDLDAGTLPGGQAKMLAVKVKATKPGKYDNSAEATAAGDLKASSGSVSTVVRQPSLRLAESCEREVYTGKNATFDYTVTNAGDMPCNATLTATVPAGSAFVSATDGGTASGGTVQWMLGSVAPGQSRKVSAVFKPGAGVTTIKSDSKVVCTCSSTAEASCVTNIVGIPAQLLDGFDHPDPVAVGQTTTYTLVITNQGTTPLTGVKLVCTMDGDSMHYVSSNGPTEGMVNGLTITFAPIASVGPGERRTYNIIVKAMKPGQVSFKAETSSDQITRTLTKTETTNFYK